jgi:hypothetical protein
MVRGMGSGMGPRIMKVRAMKEWRYRMGNHCNFGLIKFAAIYGVSHKLRRVFVEPSLPGTYRTNCRLYRVPVAHISQASLRSLVIHSPFSSARQLLLRSLFCHTGVDYLCSNSTRFEELAAAFQIRRRADLVLLVIRNLHEHVH